MKLATAPVRPLIIVTAGLAALGTAAVLGLPRLVIAPDARPAAAASAAPPQGAYWHTRKLSERTEARALGRGANQYWVVVPELTEEWTMADGRAWFAIRKLGAYPQSAADRAAWRRDGSPAKWTRTAKGQVVRLSTEPDKGGLFPARENDQFSLAEQRLTYEEVQRLPADRDALKSWLAEAARVARAEENTVSAYVTQALPELLYRLPAPKEVRAAAYQALLTMPGVHAKATAKDGTGRTGTALSIDDQYAHRKGDTTRITEELIIDTDTMLLLSESWTTTKDGKLFRDKTSTQTLLEAGWTDAQPAVPAVPATPAGP
jgi:hypothetical protein